MEYNAVSPWGVAARRDRAVRQHTWAAACGVRGLRAWRDQRQDLWERAAEAPAVVCGPLELETPDGIFPRVDFDRGDRRDGRSYAVTRPDAGRTLPQAMADSRGRVLRDTCESRRRGAHRCPSRSLSDAGAFGRRGRSEHDRHGSLDTQARHLGRGLD